MLRILLFIALALLLVWLFRRSFGGGDAMTPEQAARVLDVPVDASADEIAAAHKRLIAKLHPDTGGSSDLAARINLARDTLLRRLSK